MEIKLFFLVLAERPKEATASAIEKNFYDSELKTDGWNSSQIKITTYEYCNNSNGNDTSLTTINQ